MAIYYREITVDTTAPASPGIGEIWIDPIGSATYNVYIWLDSWVLWTGGGIYITETDADAHYLNVIVQEDTPDTIIQTGWIWVKESMLTAYLYLLGTYVPIGTG